jgi:hypothetical protein
VVITRSAFGKLICLPLEPSAGQGLLHGPVSTRLAKVSMVEAVQ